MYNSRWFHIFLTTDIRIFISYLTHQQIKYLVLRSILYPICTLFIYTILTKGFLLSVLESNPQQNNFNCDLQAFTPGVYAIRIAAGVRQTNKKFVKN